jgi:ACT domain-containing protein
MGRRTVTVDVDVDVEIEDFDSEDLINELEYRGYVVLDKDEEKVRETNSDRILWHIRQSYITDTPENFRKFLELKFLDMDMPT